MNCDPPRFVGGSSTHRTRDGRHITMNIGGAHNWARIARALGHAGEPMPPKPADANALVGSWVVTLDSDAVVAAMESTGAPYGLTLSMHEAVEHPHLAARGMIAEVDDPLDGRVRAVDSALFFSDAVSSATGPAPLAGQHARDVLREAGYDDARIEAVLAGGGVSEQAVPSR